MLSLGPSLVATRWMQCWCAVPGKGSHNNTFRTLERSLLAAGTDGYADTEGGTTLECTVRVLVRFTEIRVLQTHTQSLSDRSLGGLGRAEVLPGQQRAASASAACGAGTARKKCRDIEQKSSPSTNSNGYQQISRNIEGNCMPPILRATHTPKRTI